MDQSFSPSTHSLGAEGMQLSVSCISLAPSFVGANAKFKILSLFIQDFAKACSISFFVGLCNCVSQ